MTGGHPPGVMRRLLWVTDIPTPYRNFRYMRMAEIFPSLGLDLEVQFMAWSDPIRPWSFRPSQLHYPHRVHPGINFHRVADSFHVNPGLWWTLARERCDIVVIAGWASPSAMLAPFVLPSRALRLLESESNIESGRYLTGAARWLKRSVIHRYHGFIGPSLRSRALLTLLDPASADRPFLEFPNLIDKTVFGDGVAVARKERDRIRSEMGLAAETALWVCPARLETFKGLHLFLPLLEGVGGIRLVVCGEGSLRRALQEMIDARRLPVQLAGQKGEREMVDLYAAADVFVLPSLGDPSPLSPIEACAAQLPVFASRKIGNFDDVVAEGVNGWGYDADRPESNRETIRRIASTPREALAAMGSRSRDLYDRRFDSDTCITRVGEGIVELHRRHTRGA